MHPAYTVHTWQRAHQSSSSLVTRCVNTYRVFKKERHIDFLLSFWLFLSDFGGFGLTNNACWNEINQNKWQKQCCCLPRRKNHATGKGLMRRWLDLHYENSKKRVQDQQYPPDFDLEWLNKSLLIPKKEVPHSRASSATPWPSPCPRAFATR